MRRELVEVSPVIDYVLFAKRVMEPQPAAAEELASLLVRCSAHPPRRRGDYGFDRQHIIRTMFCRKFVPKSGQQLFGRAGSCVLIEVGTARIRISCRAVTKRVFRGTLNVTLLVCANVWFGRDSRHP